ncbi:hypothetical protein [Halohasta salina]|uniref:hypothetical protein n=1 Tax=Halohasta salina TaxID=2961621 RepID=UPI0020A36515|nr:hypothetical protein [Halohasta salina]
MSEQYRRPAEAQLPQTLRALRQDLLDGFESRKAVLLWLQELAISTLGQVATARYADFAYEFRPDTNYHEGVVLSAFLTPAARSRNLADDVASRARQQWAANVIAPIQTRTFRSIRNQATEYVGSDDDTDEPGYDPDEQTMAVRPALEELHVHQQETLRRVLGTGLEDRADILDWGDDLMLATRGEPVSDGRAPGELIRDLHNDPSGDRIMCSADPAWRMHRQLWVCRNLLPAFNRAVQDMTDRSIEEPQTDTTPDDTGGSHL